MTHSALEICAAGLRSEVKPLVVEGFAGLGGWSEGFIAEGWQAIGFDIEQHMYGDQRYPGQLILQDALTVHGRQFRHADCLVMSPPCTEYSYMAMPWQRAKQIAAALRGQGEFPEGYSGSRTIAELNALFDACFRIQREAIEATGRDCPACYGLGPRHRGHVCPKCNGTCWVTRHIPMVVENVKGAQPWVGRAAWHYGSFYLWGDVPALMPITAGRKNNGGSWFAIANNTASGHSQNPDGRKVPGLNWSGSDKPGYKAEAFNTTAEKRFRDTDGLKLGSAAYQPGAVMPRGVGATSWFHGNTKHELRGTSSGSQARKAASAQIAKIPFPLSSHIARWYKPEPEAVSA